MTDPAAVPPSLPATSGQETTTPRRVALGDWVIVRVNEGAKHTVVEVVKGQQVRLLRKRVFNALELVNHYYGEFLELDKKNCVKTWDRAQAVQVSKPDEEQYDKIGDNRNIKRNDPSVQSLSAEQIEEMKKDDDIDGAAMVDRVAASNVGFDTKTVFSQEKYLKKKRAKHLSVIQILRPTARTIMEAYLGKGPGKVFYLRPDSLAQILNLSNATANHNMMVHESCSGLVIGALAERLGGYGNIISLFMEQDTPVNNAFRCFNFTPEVAATHLPVPFHQLHTLADMELADFTKAAEDPAFQFPFRRAKPGALETLKKARQVLEKPVDSLVIASRFNPAEVLYELFKYVRGSGQVVLFHTHLEPLLQCHEMLHASEEAICIELRESWFRDYQVLPQRTHPMMRTHGTSGYILSATKVIYSERPRRPGPTPSKKQRSE